MLSHRPRDLPAWLDAVIALGSLLFFPLWLVASYHLMQPLRERLVGRFTRPEQR